MYSITRMTMAGLVAAALAVAPVSAGVQGQGSGGGAADQQAVRQHLSAARQALAELTKLPAAAQLQGEQRDAITKFISDFNTFATATSDWRSKYNVVDESLDRLLADAGTGAGESAPATTPAPAEGGEAAEGSGALDPTIVEKLQTVRTELNGFEVASGDPVFIVESIEQTLSEASTGSGANLSQSQVQEIRRQLDRIRKAAGG